MVRPPTLSCLPKEKSSELKKCTAGIERPSGPPVIPVVFWNTLTPMNTSPSVTIAR